MAEKDRVRTEQFRFTLLPEEDAMPNIPSICIPSETDMDGTRVLTERISVRFVITLFPCLVHSLYGK